jgi:hypothetical protein
MKRALVMVGTLTTGAAAAPLGPVNQAATVETGNDLLVNVGYGRGWGHRHRGASFGFYLGAPAYYSYSRCWWSHRWHRRVCTY